jgi:hypothetical protein
MPINKTFFFLEQEFQTSSKDAKEGTNRILLNPKHKSQQRSLIRLRPTITMIFSKIFCIPCFLSLILRVSTTEAFVPTLLKSHPTSALHVSVVSNFLTKDEAEQKLKQAFEDHTPESVGVQEIADGSPESHSTRGRKRSRRRNHNYSEKTKFLQEKPDTDFYTLHSSAVSHLQRDTPINDIM